MTNWVVLLPGLDFTDGVIKFDALGQSEPPQSNFLGISFRYVDEHTHDAVYFRPFDFHAEDPERKIHAVQYISHPQHHWFDLRENHNGLYEKPITPAPSGDDWFHAKIVITHPTVSVFVDGATDPCLVVEELAAGAWRRSWPVGRPRSRRPLRQPDGYRRPRQTAR